MNTNVHTIAHLSTYSNIPVAQLDYLDSNLSKAANILYQKAYRMSWKTNGIIIKSLNYFSKVMNYSVRYVKRLWSELEKYGCVDKEARYDKGGRLCNKYVLRFPQEVIDKIVKTPRKKTLRAQLNDLHQRTIYSHIDYSTPLQAAYDEPCTTPPRELQFPTLISSDLKVSNNNKQSNVNACGIVIRNSKIPTKEGNKLILDREPTPLGEYWEANVKEFIHSLPGISNPVELYREMEFSISRRFFAGQTLMHAVHTAKKLVRDGKWTRPFGLIRLEPDYHVDVPMEDNPDDLTPVSPDVHRLMAGIFQTGSYNPRREVDSPNERPAYFVSDRSPTESLATRDERMRQLSVLALSLDHDIRTQAELDLRDLMMSRP